MGLLFERDIERIWTCNFQWITGVKMNRTDKKAKQPMMIRRYNQICRSDTSFFAFSVRISSSCSERSLDDLMNTLARDDLPWSSRIVASAGELSSSLANAKGVLFLSVEVACIGVVEETLDYVGRSGQSVPRDVDSTLETSNRTWSMHVRQIESRLM